MIITDETSQFTRSCQSFISSANLHFRWVAHYFHLATKITANPCHFDHSSYHHFLPRTAPRGPHYPSDASQSEYDEDEDRPRKKSRSRRPKSSTSRRGSSSDSVSSNDSLSSEFRQNKENTRRDQNRDIMAPSRRLSTQKKTAAAKKKDKTAKTRRTPRGAKQDDRDSDYAIGPTDDEEESDSETGAQILTKQTIPTQAAKKIKEKDLEIFALKSALAKAQAGSSNTVLKKTKMTPEEKNWYNSIVTANKKFNWGKVKFCNSDSKLIGLTGNIFDKWNLKEFDGLGEKEKQEAKVSWVT